MIQFIGGNFATNSLVSFANRQLNLFEGDRNCGGGALGAAMSKACRKYGALQRKRTEKLLKE